MYDQANVNAWKNMCDPYITNLLSAENNMVHASSQNSLHTTDVCW